MFVRYTSDRTTDIAAPGTTPTPVPTVTETPLMAPAVADVDATIATSVAEEQPSAQMPVQVTEGSSDVTLPSTEDTPSTETQPR